jgi:AcrR family transcriptional regulator
MTDDQKSNPVNSQRASRILDAAAELVLRHGYRRVSIEDIATRAGIGKGTVYLHWRNREALFYALLVRESLDIVRGQIERMRDDPAEILPHRSVRGILERSMARPLLSAMLTKDGEVLGKLVEQSSQDSLELRGLEINGAYLRLLRDHGLVRTDLDPDAQLYALEIICGGYSLMEPWLPAPLQLPPAVKADALAHVIRSTLEPAGPPDPDALAEAAPRVVELFERIYDLSSAAVDGDQTTRE